MSRRQKYVLNREQMFVPASDLVNSNRQHSPASSSL